MLSIGELASCAGVTVRAVRHYHAKGLLPEPDRDRSGYRRYDAGALVELLRIRALAESGVPLARVRELLGATEGEFTAAIADIDRRLRAEIRERQRRRERIARLAAGERLALPGEVVGYLEQLRRIGVDERIVVAERDGWIPLVAQLPERVPEWMSRKREQLADPRIAEFYLALGRTLDRPDDDPGLVALADSLAARLALMADERGEAYVDDVDLAPAVVTLMDTRVFDLLPTARRFVGLMEERGWSGWTKLTRQDR